MDHIYKKFGTKVALIALPFILLIVGYNYHNNQQTKVLDKVTAVFETSEIVDKQLLSFGIWKLEDDKWNCSLGVSLSDVDFCNQTKSFNNDNFVKQFQIRLEMEDSITIEVNPSRSTFERYWIGPYKSIFGDEVNWTGKSFYVYYFQVGDRSDLRVVAYSLAGDKTKTIRLLINHYIDTIDSL